MEGGGDIANCLKCRHAKEIERLRKACLACSIGGEGCGLSRKGVSFVSLDAAKDGHNRDAILARRVGRYRPEIVQTPLGADERERHARLLNLFAQLTYDEAGMVCRMMGGATLDEVAKEAGELPQTVHSRWQSLCRREPAFLSLANGMIGSGRGRKPQPKRERQMEFTL